MTLNDLAAPLTDVGSRRMRVATGFFLIIAVLMALDMGSDAGTGADRWHLIGESAVMMVSFAGVAVLWRSWRTAEVRAARLDVDLEAARREAARFRDETRDVLAGLGAAIDKQFGRWQLTVAEREIGLLLLKGLSHREVAELRQTSEATVRQQALALYRKAGLRSRSDLSAFFLEDLLAPSVSTTSVGPVQSRVSE